MLKKLFVLCVATCSIVKIEASGFSTTQRPCTPPNQIVPAPTTPPNQIVPAPTTPPNQKELYAQAKRAGMAAAAIERQRNLGRVRPLDFTSQPSGPQMPASVPAWTLR